MLERAGLNISGYPWFHARFRGSLTAFVCGDRRVTWAEFDTAHFRFVTGTPGQCESRPRVTRRFCTRCGTQLTYQHADEPDIIDVTVGSLDKPEDLQPEDHIWTDRMLPFIKPADGLPHYPRSRFTDDTS